MLTFGELFAGIGGFSLGLERAGMKCRWQVEIDDYANRVLQKHWPSVERWGDIRTFPPDENKAWEVDLICAGVPCQPVSLAGKQKGADDGRWMWGEFLRVVATLRPSIVVAENPASILSHDKGSTFAGIVAAICAAGYDVEWKTISAADVGAPHKRERVWLLAYANSKRNAVRRHSEAVPEEMACRGCHARGSQRDCWTRCEGSPVQGASTSKEPAFDNQWSSEPAVGRVVNGIPHRVDRLRCLGNAVVPQVVELIGRAIMEREHGNPQQ